MGGGVSIRRIGWGVSLSRIGAAGHAAWQGAQWCLHQIHDYLQFLLVLGWVGDRVPSGEVFCPLLFLRSGWGG